MHFGVATLHDLVGVTAEAKHRNASHVALLLKKVSAWLGEWYSAHLQHDPLGHVGITDVITLMGFYTSVAMTLACYDVPADVPGMPR